MPPRTTDRVALRPRRRRALRGRAPAAAALLAALLLAAAEAGGGWLLGGVDDVAEPRPELVAALHHAADAARAAHGLAPTAWDEGLARAARQHAAELAARGLLDHASPTPGRHTVADRLARAGSPYATHGENLALVRSGPDVARSAVDGWLASPPHRANLLAPAFDRVGFGTAVDAAGAVYIVQLLAEVPWAPRAWSATLVEVAATGIALGLRLDRRLTAWVEVAGRGERVELAAGTQRWQAEADGPGPWPVRIGVLTRSPNGFTLDDAGAVAVSGRWRPDDAPRAWLRVTGAEAMPVRRAVVRLRIEAPPHGLALLVGGRHRPEAAAGAGTVALDLDLADGAEVRLELAEPDGSGLLQVRYGWVVRREGPSLSWAARP